MVADAWSTDAATSARMRATPSKATRLEERVRLALLARGLRYRLQYKPLPGLRHRADFAFLAARVVVDVRGCFWHGCLDHGRPAKTNAARWQRKFEENRARDARVVEVLEAQGWEVVVIWEHDDIELAVEELVRVLELRRPRHRRPPNERSRTSLSR